ncbi:hypothetical protein BC829DRAFT_248651 [Chytridium lagenaria]|nr:hypothetical protein BC829DRAFT_248651 [Chytridium lagenaria]
MLPSRFSFVNVPESPLWSPTNQSWNDFHKTDSPQLQSLQGSTRQSFQPSSTYNTSKRGSSTSDASFYSPGNSPALFPSLSIGMSALPQPLPSSSFAAPPPNSPPTTPMNSAPATPIALTAARAAGYSPAIVPRRRSTVAMSTRSIRSAKTPSMRIAYIPPTTPDEQETDEDIVVMLRPDQVEPPVLMTPITLTCCLLTAKCIVMKS